MGSHIGLVASSMLLAMPQGRSRNDIRDAARRFALEWSDDFYERGEAQSFWTEFLAVFGVNRRRVNAAFERHARRTSTGRAGFIDLLWPRMLLAEHKSRGENLDSALGQALDYIESLADAELPKFVVVSDFARIRVVDLDDADRVADEFPLSELPNHIDQFLSLAGYTSRRFSAEDAVNIKAAELLGKVYDEIAETGYSGHPLRVFLVRLLFLLFGDDSGLWERNLFADLVDNRTAEDGSDRDDAVRRRSRASRGCTCFADWHAIRDQECNRPASVVRRGSGSSSGCNRLIWRRSILSCSM